MTNNNIEQKKKKIDIWKIAKAVMFAFMGIRKKSDLESEESLTPAQVIIGGIIGAILFVLCVMLVVRLVVS